MPPASSDLLFTDAHIAQFLGSVERFDGYSVVRTPDNPGFYFGNFLILDKPPTELATWLRVFEETFGPEIKHRCLAWAEIGLEENVKKEAESLGLESAATAELQLVESALRKMGHAADELTIRPLQPEVDWDASVALGIASDRATADANEDYRIFTERQRAARKELLTRGLATWWGAFRDDQLVGQCGFVVCDEVGRFQAVETHPQWRRRGVCSALISAVARDAFSRQRVKRLVLAAEIDGPAIGLYTRIGFRETGRAHALMRHPDPMRVRDEELGDQAGVRSLVSAAFQGPPEALLVEQLRASQGAISLVAELSNSLLGHILFSRLALESAHSEPFAVALAPLAVRPASQGRGVGSALVKAGLERCRLAGYRICVVIGAPGFYGRFGFVPASPHDLHNPFGIADEHFMVRELVPGALKGHGGELIFAPAFDAIP